MALSSAMPKLSSGAESTDTPPDAGVDQLPRSMGWTSGGLRAERQTYTRQEGLLDDANLKHTGVGNLERGIKRPKRTVVLGAAGRDLGDSAAGTGKICGILLSQRRVEGPPEFLDGLVRVVLEYRSFGILAQPVFLRSTSSQHRGVAFQGCHDPIPGGILPPRRRAIPPGAYPFWVLR